MKAKVLKSFNCAVVAHQVVNLAEGDVVELDEARIDVEGLLTGGYIEAAKEGKKGKGKGADEAPPEAAAAEPEAEAPAAEAPAQ